MSNRSRVLLIDDDRILQRVLERLLHQQDIDVLSASTGQDGLAMAARHQPQLIICDWCMPQMDGLDVCRSLKADPVLADIFFILLTSRGDLQDRVAGLDAGADDFLTKPVESAELTARVRAGLRLYNKSHELRVLSQDLADQKRRLEQELTKAADYVSSILPAPLRGDVRVDSLFLPSSQLGGDCFDFYWLDEQHLVIYILDVSGHGLAAALPSISIHNLLRTQARVSQRPAISHTRRQGDCFLQRPDVVLSYLNRLFQMDQQNNQYFTIWYGVYDKSTGQLTYANAGHPPALLRGLDDHGHGEWLELKAPGMPIGLFDQSDYESRSCSIPSPGQLVLYTDGLYELPLPNGDMGSHEDFRALMEHHDDPGAEELKGLVDAIRSHFQVQEFSDDASIIRIQFPGHSGPALPATAMTRQGDL